MLFYNSKKCLLLKSVDICELENFLEIWAIYKAYVSKIKKCKQKYHSYKKAVVFN